MKKQWVDKSKVLYDKNYRYDKDKVLHSILDFLDESLEKCDKKQYDKLSDSLSKVFSGCITEYAKLTNKNHSDIINKCRDIIVKKDADYGKAWKDVRVTTLVDLMRAKILRIINIVQSNRKEERYFESIEDNLLDVVNYCVLTLLRADIEK